MTATAEDSTFAGAAGAPLDVMLTDATLGSIGRFLPGTAPLKWAARLALRPRTPAQRAAALSTELVKIALGRSDVAPEKKDRRFADPAWLGNPLYRRVMQAYLATGTTLERLVEDADLDWRSQQRLSFLVENLVDALAPSNTPLHPAALKAALDTGGLNFARGLRHAARDLSRPPFIPRMVDTTPFTVGDNIAATEGAVVLRTEVFELLQYRPRTERVHATPLVLVPPMINKFYVADLAPGKSMVEHFVGSGQPVFVISWRNPQREHREWTLDTYAGVVLEAIDAARAISDSERTHVLGLCAGGITASVALSHLAQTGMLHDRVASLTLGVTVLDQHQASTTGALMDERTAAMAVAATQRQGYLSGQQLAGVFAWLRPNDLVWNYWVNNYLLGKEPPAFDILFWNNDVTRMPAGLHRDFVRLALDNALVTSGAATVLGTPVDLTKVDVDTYLVAGIADHITPWQSCYRSAALFGSTPRFVLSTSGHIAALVNPPGNPKASFRTNEAMPGDPEEWLHGAVQQPGSWWPDWSAWVAERSGGERDAPAELGGAGFEVLEPAPGHYVCET